MNEQIVYKKTSIWSTWSVSISILIALSLLATGILSVRAAERTLSRVSSGVVNTMNSSASTLLTQRNKYNRQTNGDTGDGKLECQVGSIINSETVILTGVEGNCGKGEEVEDFDIFYVFPAESVKDTGEFIEPIPDSVEPKGRVVVVDVFEETCETQLIGSFSPSSGDLALPESDDLNGSGEDGVDLVPYCDQVTFTPHDITTSADDARLVYATDIDGDGDTDVLSAFQNDLTVAWYENDGNGAFAVHAISTSAKVAYSSSVYATDVDGDGDTDVLSASRGDDTVTWYENGCI